MKMLANNPTRSVREGTPIFTFLPKGKSRGAIAVVESAVAPEAAREQLSAVF
jgi:hypothetical protein